MGTDTCVTLARPDFPRPRGPRYFKEKRTG